ncbi:alpha/beta hydrolase [Parvularcula sp. IMCC14364]|uniref:alpha/beta hydrolase n=1 Tax=Parvularcula sp. IMCC14364 TaxID=3067902 RepID=UPI00274197D5|nr:alpha/beta hydrolase [Parvularcula sp. IMCC14364]
MTLMTEPADFIRIAEAPVPEGAEAFYLPTPDNARLRVAAFPVDDAVGTVLLLTGWSEFIEKYMEVVADLQARRFNVAMMDWRGQGLSDRLLPIREKGHILSFGTHAEDLKYVAENFVRQRFPGKLSVMAHSMGGAITLLALSDGYSAFDRAIFSSPMTRIFPQRWKRIIVRSLAATGCALGASRVSIPFVKEHARKFEGNNLTHDQRRHTMYRKLLDAAPNAALHGPTFGWVNAATEAVGRLNRQGALSGVKIPVKMVSAGNDQTVDGRNASRLARQYDALETVVIKGGYHELLMEDDRYRDQFWSEFDSFFAAS